MAILDARGISCPEPLLMLKKALQTETQLTLLVDSKNALENCESYAKKQGYTVTTEMQGDTFRTLVSK